MKFYKKAQETVGKHMLTLILIILIAAAIVALIYWQVTGRLDLISNIFFR